MALRPGSYAFKSETNRRYLRYIDQRINTLQESLQFSGDDVASLYTKFEVEEDADNPGLVHIKSSFNKKYWRRAEQDSSWIVAGEKEQQRDQNQWSCTLFKPEVVQLTPASGNRTIGLFRFRHVQLGHYIEPFSKDEYQLLLFAGRATQPDTQNVVFTIEDLAQRSS